MRESFNATAFDSTTYDLLEEGRPAVGCFRAAFRRTDWKPRRLLRSLE